MSEEMDPDSEEATAPDSPKPPRSARGRRVFHSQQSEAARTVVACQNCRQKKVKCDGQCPCKYCSKRNLSCQFSAAEKRKMFSVSEIRQLQAKVARYEADKGPGQSRARTPAETETPERMGITEAAITTHNATQPEAAAAAAAVRTPAPQAPRASLRSPSSYGPNMFASPRSNVSMPSNGPGVPVVPPSSSSPSVHTVNTAMAPETLLSSTDAFGSEVRTLVSSRPNPGSAKTTPTATVSSAPHELESLDRIPGWPSEEEAYGLLELVVLQVGISQQLFDVRAFSDNMSHLFHDSSSGKALSSIWYTEALLVMAIGRLLAAKSDGPSDVPGESLYNAALNRLPRPGDTKKYGILGIEVVALTALYLQVADRKEEAYIYASMALRLAIAHNLHSKRHNTKRLSRSESVHRNRLWWSVYMQERRLAAAGGHPMGIDDKAVTIDPPSDALGFPSASAIGVNVRAARITGQITSTIYSSHSSAELSFIDDVQEIINSLHEIRSSMPAEYHMSMRDSQLTIAGRLFGEVDPQTARTSSSLYLSVHQAVIHAVRPVLLYMARGSGDGDMQAYNDLSPTLRRLAEICVEAASKSLAILNELRDRDIIAKNCFLDLDAVFSVGFIFVLVEVINRGKNLGKSGIEGSRSILEYLVRLGNRAAAKRLAEMDQMCAYLEPQPTQPQVDETPADLLLDNFSFELGYVNPEAATQYSRDAAPASVHRKDMPHDELANRVGNDPGPNPAGETWMNTDLADISLEGENGLFWVFQPGFYTGEELADWETLESCLAMNQAP